MFAEAEMHRTCKITHGHLQAYLIHAGNLMSCEIRALGIDKGCVQMLVDLSAHISIIDFIKNTQNWTSMWITENVKNHFWSSQYFIMPISPEDKAAACDYIKDMSATILPNLNHLHTFGTNDNPEPYNFHHIIIITNGGKLSLRLKFRLLFDNALKDVSSNLGMSDVVCSSMRNHAHILARVPSNLCLSDLIEGVKSNVLEWMHSNLHFRRFDKWSDKSIAYTISPQRIKDEIYKLMHQYEIHFRYNLVNEMSPLYQKMEIPFIQSLN